jgi:hypothetical protein
MISVVSVISMIPAVSAIGCVNLLIILLLLRGPLATGLKKPSPGLGSLNAYTSGCKKIGHHFGLLHGDLLNSLDTIHPITKSIDNLNVLDVRDSLPGIAKIFHVVLKTLIMLLLDGLQGFSCRWTLVCTLEVLDEHGT